MSTCTGSDCYDCYADKFAETQVDAAIEALKAEGSHYFTLHQPNPLNVPPKTPGTLCFIKDEEE